MTLEKTTRVSSSSSSLSTSSTASDLVIAGTCLSMCPEKEREEREANQLLHPFEVERGTENYRKPLADRRRIVKAFRRPAAGKGIPPEELRPARVLTNTVKFLLGDLLKDLAKRPEGIYTLDVYEFVFDRLRAVRQDLIVQRVGGEAAVFVYEQALAFLVIFGYRLCNSKDFVVKFNETHVTECFGQLFSHYETLAPTLLRTSAKNGVTSGAAISSHRRFVRNYALFHALETLNSLDQSDSLHRLLNRVPERFHGRPPISTAVNIAKAFQSGNYHRFFKIVARDVQSPLMLAVIMKHCVYVQIRALNVMSHAYSAKNLSYPLDRLSQLLMFRSEEETVAVLSSLGIKTVENRVIFSKSGPLPVDDMDRAPKWKRFRFIDDLLFRFPLFPLKN